MKLKLAIASCVAALALPMAPALAGDAIPGTCYETTMAEGKLPRTTTYPCECLVGIQGFSVEWVGNYPWITITYCHVFIPRGGSGN